ncbi:Retrovirus-related Pol polyprotein from transposon RE2 [Vitis vinifera]|uniref:Retrovirus-related Pol polyprotein from transposon RE2 n=1 Tax=Vitis vinifera TaxID=29760 RepID=A0A438F0Z9_VITVI|nr:Retrovirus-related Pol polyprotein from transposon RE2 [Vitis vinifera]
MATSSSDSFPIAINATSKLLHVSHQPTSLHGMPNLSLSSSAITSLAMSMALIPAHPYRLSPAMIPLIATSQTSYQAWTKLTKLYASRSRTRVMQLKEDLTLMQRGNRSITEYLHSVKTIANELALIDAPLSQDDITLYVLHGLGSDFRDIIAPIRARESSLSFEELHDLLLGHEAYLRRLDSTAQSLVITANTTQRRDSRSSKNQSSSTYQQSKNDSRSKSRQSKQYKYPPRCQYCDQQGHIAKYYPKLKPSEATVNCTTTTSSPDKRWLIDSAASHNITSQVSNLQFHSEYDGTDEVIIGDGSGLPITHSGSLTLSFPNKKFQVEDTLCVPTINKNLISVHHFTKQNNVILEFHPTYFLVKDRRMGEILLQGPCENGVYPLPSSPAATPIAFVHERTSVAGWHQLLGHPSFKVVTRLISFFSLPTTSCLSGSNNCHSCSTNKAHQLPFHKHGLTSTTPFDLLYTDIWGPSPTPSLNGHRYYVIFVDHFTKYVWSLSDNGGEFTVLRPFFTTHGISHYTTAPYTPQQNGVSKRRHRHIVETGQTLLSHVSLPSEYWAYAFATATYLINRLPSPVLHHKSPLQALFKQQPWYEKLRSFGCLCFPLMKPYNTNKFQKKSVPCIFVGYSTSQRPILQLASKELPAITRAQGDIPSASSTPSEDPALVQPQEAPLSTSDQVTLRPSTFVSQPENSIPSSPPPCPRTIITRSMNNIFRPKQLHTTTKHPLHEPPESSCVSQALKDPHWCKAMSEEVTALLQHGMWELVPPTPGQNLVGCIDYSQTFSPVVKPATIRLLLTIVVMHGWPLRQLDINNAFLHGNLEETVFMHQPPGFEDPSQPQHVCKLKRVSMVLNKPHDSGIRPSGCTPQLWGSFYLNISIYGISFHEPPWKMLKKHSLQCPLQPSLRFKIILNVLTALSIAKIIRPLQYLGLTRPDIAFAVNRLSQFMQKPTTNHWAAAKRLLRYLKQTMFHGILLQKHDQFQLKTYSDADWASNTDTRVSTTAFITFIGPNPISWSARKQRAVSRSSTEAEFRALATATSKTVWLHSLIKDLVSLSEKHLKCFVIILAPTISI